MTDTIKCVVFAYTRSETVVEIDDRYGVYGPSYARYNLPCELVDKYNKAAMRWSEVQRELTEFLTTHDPVK